LFQTLDFGISFKRKTNTIQVPLLVFFPHSGIFLGLLLLKVDGDDMKMKKRRIRWRKPNVFELKLTERTKMCNREKLRDQHKSNFN